MLPNFYNNHKRIIQTPHHVMILTEMNHDARIIKNEHRPSPKPHQDMAGRQYWALGRRYAGCGHH